MNDKNLYRHGPTRSELWFWLWISAGGFGLMGVALFVRGIPEGPAIAEVVGLGSVVFGYLGGRSVKRLIRRQHP
jgi:hypothetical protein